MFPSHSELLHHKEVIAFAFGLTNRPDDFIDIIYDKTMTPFEEYATELPWEYDRWMPDLQATEHSLSVVRDYITPERVETKIVDAMRARHFCVLKRDLKDFVPSRMYVIEDSVRAPLAIIYQDPSLPGHDLQGANRSDATKYLIIADDFSLNVSMELMKKLSECYDVRITKLYSEDVQIGYFVPPEGCLNMNICPPKRWVSWTIVTQIKRRKLRSAYAKVVPEGAVVCFEQFTDSVFLGSNYAKSLEITGSKLPSPAIQRLAREFYGYDRTAAEGCREDNSSETNDTKHSPFTILDISNAVISEDECKCLVEPMKLAHLRELHISSYCLDTNLNDLGLNCTSLEELHLYSEVEQQTNDNIRMTTQRKGSHYPDRLTNKKCFQKLRHLSVLGLLTDRVVDLLMLELPELRIELEQVCEADLNNLAQVIMLLTPYLKVLGLFGNMPIGLLAYRISYESYQRHKCQKLVLEFSDSKISRSIEALAYQVTFDQFPYLTYLGVNCLGSPTDELESALKFLARASVTHYGERSLDIIMLCDPRWKFSQSFKETMKSLCSSPSNYFETWPPPREAQMSPPRAYRGTQASTPKGTQPSSPKDTEHLLSSGTQNLPPMGTQISRRSETFPIVHYKI